MKALEEAISVGRTAGLPVQISHHKAASKVVWGKSVDTLAMIERARSEGVDVSVDQYPYRAGATSLATLLPPWAHEGGIERLLERLHDGELRQKMREDIEKGIPGWENFAGELGWESIYISRVKSDENKPLEGMNLTEITKLRGDADPITSLFEVLSEEEGAAGMILFSMNEDDIKRIMRHPVHMVGTDSGSMSPTGYMSRGKPHPRGYGSYPKILGRYVREMSVLKLEDAVRKMTSMPAQRFGLLDRGLLRPGMCADIVVFNPDTVMDRATYQDPHQFPEGIEYVLVNGKVAVDGGKYSPVLAGRTLRKK
jgi:N-acyl-D-amino-acid deacylase